MDDDMRLSELAKQIEDYIAKNGDVEVSFLQGNENRGHFREPMFRVKELEIPNFYHEKVNALML